MAAPPPPPDPAFLMDELVEQFLLRLPPEDPADLARAALVSRQWHRVVTGAGFRRRYMDFHSSPPLLGYIASLADSIRFVPMSSSFRPPHVYHRRDVRAVHSSHGRILLRSTQDWELDDHELYLFVWDPITNKEWELPVLLSTPGPYISNWDAAVVCAVGEGCCHLDCHFKVVVVGVSGGRTFSCFCSFQDHSWTDRIFVSWGGSCLSMMGSALVGNTLYFMRGSSYLGETIILKYDLPTHQMCMISVQCEVQLGMEGRLIGTQDGRLGLAMTSNSTLCLWIREQGRWAESRVIQLDALLPPEAVEGIFKPLVCGFAETGAGIIFLCTRVGVFTIDLNSGTSKKVREAFSSRFHVFPYVSFCTPAPGKISTDEGPGSSVVISADDEPGAGAVASRDEVPRDVVVSMVEGLGAGVSSA